MKFVLVNGRTPRPQSFCALCCEPIGESYLRDLQRGSPTAITSATPVTARLPSQRSKSMRGRHDNHRRFEVPAANGSRPIAGRRQSVRTLSQRMGFAVEAIVAEKYSIAFFCSAGCYLNAIPSNCCARV
jgi:hypothetical protein